MEITAKRCAAVAALVLGAACGGSPAAVDDGGERTLPRATEIAGGGGYACAILEDRRVICTGTVAGAPSLTDVSAIASGGLEHACGIRETGSVICWGINTHNKLAGSTGSFLETAAGTQHSCAVRSDGAIRCWGLNDRGQTDAPDGTGFRAISASRAGHHTCAIEGQNGVVCWGGDEAAHARGLPAADYQSLSLTENGGCALTRGTGFIRCWGESFAGLPADGGFTAISTGRDFVCGIRNAQVACFGASGSTLPSQTPPGPFARIGAGHAHVCALRTDGSVACWGAIDLFPGVAR
jgi:hypothetical protein